MAKPLCPHFGKCGGCSSQHINYSIQLENKKKALVNAVNFSEVRVFYDKEYHYRNRMEFIFHHKGLGLRKKDYEIMDIEQCMISNEKVNNLLKEVRGFFKEPDYFNFKKLSGTFMYAVIRASGEDSSISFVLNEESIRLKEAVEKVKEFAAETSANNVIVTYTTPKDDAMFSNEFFVVKGNDMLKEKYLGTELVYSVQGFFQNNPVMAEKMHEYCHELLKKYDTKGAYLLDLYAGVGGFGIINAGLFKRVVMIESVKQCVESAKINIRNNDIQNAEVLLLDAKQLKRVEFPKNLFVITDPPRSGMHLNTIEQIKNLRPKVIVYVSCNVEQLKKDILKFKEYKVKSAALFDFFPQTNHSEAVVELVLEDIP